jgi:hypothetical protein
MHPWILSTKDRIFEMRMPPYNTDEEVDAFCKAHVEWARKNQCPHAHVFDMRDALSLTATQRRRYAQHVIDMDPLDTRWNRGVAFIADNPIVRGIITAVFWISPPPFPYRVFRTPTEGREWLKSQLKNG